MGQCIHAYKEDGLEFEALDVSDVEDANIGMSAHKLPAWTGDDIDIACP